MGRLAPLVAVAGVLGAPASASAKLLVETYNEGLQPHVVLGEHSAAINNPKQITVEATSSYPAELTGRFKIKCENGFSRRGTLSGKPAKRTVRIPGRQGKCQVQSADARYADPLLQGWVQIRALGS